MIDTLDEFFERLRATKMARKKMLRMEDGDRYGRKWLNENHDNNIIYNIARVDPEELFSDEDDIDASSEKSSLKLCKILNDYNFWDFVENYKVDELSDAFVQGFIRTVASSYLGFRV